MREKFKRGLAEAEGFGDIFSLVKKAVRESLGLHRAGLELVLMDLPKAMGALHHVGSNAIVMNKSLLEALAQVVRSRLELNSYVFTVLLHEYLHSLGFIDEEEVKSLVKKVVRDALGEDHLAYHMASKPIFEIYPELQVLGLSGVSGEPRLIKDFDRESAHYIS